MSEVNATRRSFLGFLGGAGLVAVGPMASEAAAAATLEAKPIRIDQWDDCGIRYFEIETQKDVDMAVLFDLGGSVPSGRSRRVLIPMEEMDPVDAGERMKRLQDEAVRSNATHAIRTTHIQRESGKVKEGMAALTSEITIEDMYVLVPVSLTKAG